MTVTQPLATAVVPGSAAAASNRSAAIDTLRGAVMVLMALDHVRAFFAREPLFGLDAISPGLFVTRWLTHFCAPVFVFLAGAGAYLHGRKKSRGELSRWLLVRGAWLVLLEVTLVRLGWTFNFDYAHYLLAGVIWCIGISMIVLAGLVLLPRVAVLVLGLVIVGGHNLLDTHFRPMQIQAQSGAWWAWPARILYLGGPIDLFGSLRVVVLYSLVPWIGVMALGYVFGAVLDRPREQRIAWCTRIGLTAIGVFCLLRAPNLYGDPRPWGSSERSWLFTVFSVVDTSKYPASLDFLLMTLGPALLALALLERRSVPGLGWLAVFGRVPLFYYLLHIPLIHGLAVLVAALRGNMDPWLFQNHPSLVPRPPEGLGYGVPMVWLFTAVTVLLLYFPCRWFAGVKTRQPDGWWRFF